jgi:MFS family permease
VADKLVSSRHLSWPQLLVAYAAGSFGFGFQNMVQFLVPLRAQELGVPLEFIGVLVGAGALVPALLSVTSGELVDRFGARQAYIGGTLVCVVSALLFVPVTAFVGLFAIQLVMGFARSTAWIASQGYVSHLGTGEERATHMGRLSFASSAGTLVAPLVIGAAAQVLGYQDAFFVAAGLASVYVLMGLVLPDVRAVRRRTERASAGFRTALSLLRSRGIQVALLLTFSRLWAASGWRPFYPIFLASHGFAPALIGTVLAANSAVSTVVTLGAGPIGRRIDPVIATAIALALGALGMALSPFVAAVPMVYLPALLTGTAAGLSLPLLMATVSTEAPPDQRGVALGLRMSANQVASTTAPIVVGSLVSAFGIVVGFAASAAFCWVILGAAVVLHVGSRVNRASPPQS